MLCTVVSQVSRRSTVEPGTRAEGSNAADSVASTRPSFSG